MEGSMQQGHPGLHWDHTLLLLRQIIARPCMQLTDARRNQEGVSMLQWACPLWVGLVLTVVLTNPHRREHNNAHTQHQSVHNALVL